MISALASEILEDLPEEFPAGASVRMLCAWLGEPKQMVRDALVELLDARLAHREDHRVLAGRRTTIGRCEGGKRGDKLCVE